MEYNEALDNEKMSVIKAQRGIENMEEMYRQIQEEEQQDDEGGEDRIIADLMSIVEDKKVGRKEESSTFSDVEP